MTTEVVTPDKVTAARAEVERLATVEREWSARRRQLTSDLAELERTSGDTVLDSVLADEGEATSKALASQLAKMRSEIETIDSTIAAARRRRLEVIPSVTACEAEQLRRQAVELRRAADEREPKTAELLDALQSWEGCEYAPKAPTRSGPYGGQVGGALNMVVVSVPRTLQLRQQADMLDRQALEAERRQPVTSGTATADNLQDLEASIFADPMRLGPPMSEVETWLARVTETALDRLRRRVLGSEEAPRFTYTVTWRTGAIIADASSCR
jgi:hypothetical protein